MTLQSTFATTRRLAGWAMLITAYCEGSLFHALYAFGFWMMIEAAVDEIKGAPKP